jgi:UDP-N-acetylmuramate dehydrogenase
MGIFKETTMNKKLYEKVYKELSKVIKKKNIKTNENMRNHTTLKIGGEATILIEPKSELEIKHIVEVAKNNNIKVYTIGRGSNILIDDNGLDGIVIKLSNKFSSVALHGEIMIARAGVSLASIAKVAMRNSLSGLEFASGIPGTLGGAIMMNAGAYGGEMKNIVEWVTILKEDGTVKELSCEDMQFSYRDSILSKNPNWIVLSAKLNLKKSTQNEILKEMLTRNEKRVISQPLDKHNCGSTFKRPEGYFAGELIENCGLKGFSHNGVSVSEKHAGFIVNEGNSTAEDMLHVINIVKKSVKDKFGVTLEEEVKYLN